MDPVRRKKKHRNGQVNLMDVVKANGMRVVEGTKLNLVGKGIDVVGHVVSTIAHTTTCLYLSQNNIPSVVDLGQFPRLKVLSLGGNLISSFEYFEEISSKLPNLRTLLLSGNPLCDAPNYRLRIILYFPQVLTLDGTEITPKEREIAPFLVAQDASLRQVVMENHFEISKLEWIVMLIQMHKEFYQVVYGSHSLPYRSDSRMPQLDKLAINVTLLLRLWKQQDAVESSPNQKQIETQLQRVVVRAFHHLLQHPLRKAKQILQKFSRKDHRLKGLEPPTPTWEEAYANVISLQQNTIAKLRGLCERNRRELIDSLKGLLVRDPSSRRYQATCEDDARRIAMTQEREMLLREYQEGERNKRSLPPQQLDPEEIPREVKSKNIKLKGRGQGDLGVSLESLSKDRTRFPLSPPPPPPSDQFIPVQRYFMHLDEDNELNTSESHDEIDYHLKAPCSYRRVEPSDDEMRYEGVKYGRETGDLNGQHQYWPSHRSSEIHDNGCTDNMRPDTQQSKLRERTMSTTRPQRREIEAVDKAPSDHHVNESPKMYSRPPSAREIFNIPPQIRHNSPAPIRAVTNATEMKPHPQKPLYRSKLRRILYKWRNQTQVLRGCAMLQAKCIFRRASRVFHIWRFYSSQQRYIRAFIESRTYRVVLSCFHKWANAQRFHAIKYFAFLRRQRERSWRVFIHWYHWTQRMRLTRHGDEKRSRRKQQHCIRQIFNSWRQYTRAQVLHAGHGRKLQHLYNKHTLQVSFDGWRIWLERQLRPRQQYESNFIAARYRRRLHDYFLAWKRLIQVSKRYKKQLYHSIWRHWQIYQTLAREKFRFTRIIERFVGKKSIRRWYSFAGERRHRLRACEIAIRHWSLQNLKQIWYHWKKYKCMRRKYIQGCIKAIKHYRIKTERRMWRIWARATATHLEYRHQQKYAKLQIGFQWFVQAVRKQRGINRIERRMKSLDDRRVLYWQQRCFQKWQLYRQRHFKLNGMMRYIRYQQEIMVQSRYWIRWKGICLKKAMKQVIDMDIQVEESNREREKVLAQVLEVNDTSIQLAEEIVSWKENCKKNENEIKKWQLIAQQREKSMVVLQQEMIGLQKEVDGMRQDDKDKDRIRQDELNDLKNEIFEIEEKKNKIKRELNDLQKEILLKEQLILKEQDKRKKRNNEIILLENELCEMKEEIKKLKEMENNLKNTIEIERIERYDIAMRCKDYEKSFVDTIDAIKKHELEQENELKESNNIAIEMERRWKEEEIKKNEILKLLHEKNNILIELKNQNEINNSIKKEKEFLYIDLYENEINDLNIKTSTIHQDIQFLQEKLKKQLKKKPIEKKQNIK